jgi:hypothetical protein
MIDGKDVQVLHQGSSAPDVEELNAEAYGEDGLIEVVGVLDKEFVYVLSWAVAGSALGDRVLAVLLGVDVGGASGEKYRVAGVDEVCNLGGSGPEGDFDGLATASLDGCGILRPGSGVVLDVGAGGDRDGDAGVHSFFNDRAVECGSARMAWI